MSRDKSGFSKVTISRNVYSISVMIQNNWMEEINKIKAVPNLYKYECQLNINEQLKTENSPIKANIKKIKTTNITKQNENVRNTMTKKKEYHNI